MPFPAETLRLVIAGEREDLSVPVAPGARMCLRFTHSLHGSLVEETFAIAADGFALIRLRYGEPRTAEYYGHDTARRDGEWWVVDGLHRALPSIALRVSAESNMRLKMAALDIRLAELTERGGAVRLSVQAAAA